MDTIIKIKKYLRIRKYLKHNIIVIVCYDMTTADHWRPFHHMSECRVLISTLEPWLSDLESKQMREQCVKTVECVTRGK